MQQRSENPPAGIQLVVTNKVRVVSLERVKDERFVGLGDLQVREAAAVGEVKLGDNSLHAQAGELRVHLNVNTLVGLHTNDKLVAWNVLENARGDILELDANLGLLLVKS